MRFALCLFLPLVVAAFPAGAAPSAQDVIAHGTGRGEKSYLWVGEIQWISADTDRTEIYGREVGAGPGWQPLMRVDERVVGMTQNSGELVLQFANGRWAWCTPPARLQYGAPMPAGIRLLGLAGDAKTLWAVGAVEPRPPATAPTTAATVPASTQPAPRQPLELVFLRYEKGIWRSRPIASDASFNATPSTVAFTLVAGDPFCCVLLDDNTVIAHRLSAASGNLSPTVTVARPAKPVLRMKLFDYSGIPMLWATGAVAPGEFWNILDQKGIPLPLKLEGAPPKAGRFDIALAGDQYRLLFERGEKPDERLFEQRYSSEAKPDGQPVQAQADTQAKDSRSWWMTSFMAGLLVVMTVQALRRQRELGRILQLPNRLVLAPIGRRVLSTLIDMIPILGGLGFEWYRQLKASNASPFASFDPTAHAVALAGMGIYLLHTFAIELFFGRTVGKMLLGLTVSTTAGEPPTPRALAIRNLLRVVPIPIDVVLVLYSPLRQRLGDLLTGTFVIRAGVKAPPEPGENIDVEA